VTSADNEPNQHESRGPAQPPRAAGLLLEVITHSCEETLALGKQLANQLRPPCVVSLEGELGSGKTTLVKGIVAGLGAAREDEVTSPSFTLVHEYGRNPRVYHADLYRVEGSRDLVTLGLEDLMNEPAVLLIEWGEKSTLATASVRIKLEHLGGDDRRIVVEGISPTDR
jgi:tRNA threonylcarbamoyladenosine biosynthesis protein TsaE